jgi:hypothetical protein
MSHFPTLFEDSFIAKEVDNSKFEKVSRLLCESQAFDTKLILDVNTELYPIAPQQVR